MENINITPASRCRVAKWREGGGSSMPYTFQKCSVCGVGEHQTCALSEEALGKLLAEKQMQQNREQQDEVKRQLSFEEVERIGRQYAKELVRRERVSIDGGQQEKSDMWKNIFTGAGITLAFLAFLFFMGYAGFKLG